MSLIFNPQNTEIRQLLDTDARPVWQRALPITSQKGDNVTVELTRKVGGSFDGPKVLPEVTTFGAPLTHKPGVYPYGSATGTTPVTSTSLKAGEYKSAKVNGKGVTKRKANKLWGRYVPINGILFSPSQTFSTGLTLNDADTFVFDMKFAASTTRSLIGASTDQGTYFGMDVSGRFELGGNVTIPVTTADPTQRNIVKFEHSGVSQPSKLTVNGYTIQRDRSGSATQQNPFRYPIPGYGGEGVTVYAYKAYQSGTLLCDRVAVKDTITNEIGYFDRLTETFTAVTGTAGDLIQPVASVNFTGTQYILPDLTGNVRWKIVAMGVKKSAQQVLLSSSQTAADATWLGEIGTTGKWGIGDNVASAVGVDTKAEIDISFSSNGATGTINGTALSYNTPAVHNTWSIGATSVGNYGFTGAIVSIQAIGNGVDSRDFMPVRIGTDYCLLDTIAFRLYRNAGTGALSGGADLPYTQLCPDILETNAGDAEYGQYGTNKLKPSKGIAEYTGITCVGDGVKFHFSGTWNGNYLYTKISGDTVASCGSANVVKTYNTEPVVIPAGTTVKFIRKDLTYIRYMYFTTIDGDSTSFAWGATELEHTYTATTDITAIWFQWSDAQRIEVPCDIYIGMFDPAETEYEDYHFGLHPSGEQTLVQEGKNWFGGTFNTRFTFYRPIKVGTTIYASGDDDSSQCYVRYYDADGNTITELRLSSTQQNRRMCSYTPAVDIHSCMFYNTSLNHLQIAETVAYESYITPQTLKIPTFLPSATSFLDAAEADNNVTCDWRFYVITGDESITMHATITGLFFFTLTNLDGLVQPTNENYGECTHLPAVRKVAGSLGEGECCFNALNASSAARFCFRTNCTSVNEMKAELAAKYAEGEPWIIAFPLATPVTTTLEIAPVTQPLGTVTILNEFADGTKGAVDFTGVNIQVDNPVPKPTEPYPLLSNAGAVAYGQYGKNLVDSAHGIKAHIKPDGTFQNPTNYDVLISDYIEVEASTGYTFSGMGNVSATSVSRTGYQYDADKNPIQQLSNSTGDPVKFTTTANTKYVVMQWRTDATPQLEKGDNATEYEPYHFGWHGDDEQTVKMEGANIWNLGDFINGVGTQKTLEGLDTSKTYTILVKASSDYSTTVTAWSVSPRNADGTSRGNLFYMNDYVAGQTILAEFTGAAMLRIQGSNFSGSFYICVVEGSATEYLPYVAPQTRITTEILPSATSKLNMQGGNNNEECDWAFKQLDGTEEYRDDSGSSYIYFIPALPRVEGYNVPIVCTHFRNEDIRKFATNNIGWDKSTLASFGIPNTIEGFKAWLAANKPIVAYPVATTVKKTVAVTPFAPTNKGTYVVSSEAALPVQTQVTYLGK